MRRFFLALFSAVVVTAMNASVGGSSAAPLSGAAFSLSPSATSPLIKVQMPCGWTYACTTVKQEVWRVPEGAEPWMGDGGAQPWRGRGCSGHWCTDRCGAFCWINRIRNGYCGHGCEAYREHVAFQPIDGNLRPFIYRNPPDGPCGGRGRWRGCGGYAPEPDGSVYDRGGGGGGDNETYGAPPQNGERFVDRLRRFFIGSPRREAYRDDAYRGETRRDEPYRDRDNGAIRFERPSHDLAPLHRFNGPKYPPNCTGKSC